ncbi:neuroligin-4, X-linked-like, partial [Thrips palmi]|uniref:Neuroligin-4, X-linked-like n=1 Tax=Thrips palmi TaxID=161013 RepID=A0A6P8YXQ2_THRPL
PANAPQALLNSRIVHTKYGDVRGIIMTHENRHLEPVEVYRGIPYAMPPVGSLRFMPPVSGAQWQGVRLAQHFPPVCPQRLPDIANETAALQRMPRGRLEALRRLLPLLANQSEDCLYLNIYTPAEAGLRENVRLAPVIVIIHGESYEWNSGNVYDGSVLASYGGVVVVTVNYRLGVLGFLNVNPDPHARSPANYGLMDQIAALHWIQENVASFGGDPGNVTLLGHGTGAACVHFLMMSSAVPDGQLFHRAILMSGSALAPGALVRDPGAQARAVAKIVNCSDDVPSRFLLACLRERPLSVLLAAVEAANKDYAADDGPGVSAFGGGAPAAFGPSVDGVVIDAGDPPPPSPGAPVSRGRANASSCMGLGLGGAGLAGLTADPVLDLVLRKAVAAKLSRYALLCGVVRAEAFLAFSSADEQFGLEADRRTRILRDFVRNTYRYHRSEILATILNEYTDWERPVQHPVNLRDETLEALSDAQVVAPVVLTADVHSSTASNKSFLYVFDYQTKNGDYQQRQGCIHGEEMAYVLGAPLSAGLRHSHLPRNFTKSEAMLSEATMNYWINFARTGTPNDPVEPARGGRHRSLEWPPYESMHNKYIVLEPKPRIKSHYRAHRLSFWLHLVPELHRPGGDLVPIGHHQLPGDPPAVAGDDSGFAAYSTALSATVAIGCSLLLLNVLVFACVYHQREKPHQNCSVAESSNNSSFRGSSSGSSALPSSLRNKKRPVENGGPHGMCKAGEHLQSCVSGGGAALKTYMGEGHAVMHRPHFHMHCGPPGCSVLPPLAHQVAHSHSLHQLPPPEFDDMPQQSFILHASAFGGSATLPRPPPPPKACKPPLSLEVGEEQPLLSASAHNLHALANKKSTPDVASGIRAGCSGMSSSVVGVGPGALGTIRRKGQPGRPYCPSQMEELRV